jgi:hypothetical protein
MVNTFIISTDLQESFALLDFKRLGKQRLEAKQIINILEKIDNGCDVSGIGFSSHPATLMWRGYTNALKIYFNLCVEEWINRGYKNTMDIYEVDYYQFPQFVTFEPFILSHKAALLRKNPEYYKDLMCDDVKPYMTLGYLWPSKVSDQMYIQWNFSYLDPMGSGVPLQYRVSEENVNTWVNEKTKNPISKRQITEKSKLYKDYKIAAKYYKLI